jgi:membrane protease YdiL (CAAX protease family)
LIKLGSFLPILLIVPAAIVISALISIAFGGDPTQLQFAEGFTFSVSMVPSLLVLILAAIFEEVGWRGYGMDSLRKNQNYFTATLIFAGLWALWHLPLFFIQGTYQNEIANENLLYAVNFFLSIIPMAFIINWVWELNSRSISAIILFHFSINLAQEALNITQTTKCIETMILTLFAIVIVLLNRSMFFSILNKINTEEE